MSGACGVDVAVPDRAVFEPCFGVCVAVKTTEDDEVEARVPGLAGVEKLLRLQRFLAAEAGDLAGHDIGKASLFGAEVASARKTRVIAVEQWTTPSWGSS